MEYNSTKQIDQSKKYNKLGVFKEIHTKKISKDLNNDSDKYTENLGTLENNTKSESVKISINDNDKYIDEWCFKVQEPIFDNVNFNCNINCNSIKNENRLIDDRQKANMLFKQTKPESKLPNNNKLLNTNNIMYSETKVSSNNKLLSPNSLFVGSTKKQTYGIIDLERDLNLNSFIITDKMFDQCKGQFDSIITCYNGSKLIQKAIDKNSLKVNELILLEVSIILS